MCTKCNGLGRKTREVFSGVWSFEVCNCEESFTIRETRYRESIERMAKLRQELKMMKKKAV